MSRASRDWDSTAARVLLGLIIFSFAGAALVQGIGYGVTSKNNQKFWMDFCVWLGFVLYVLGLIYLIVLIAAYPQRCYAAK